MAAYILNVIYRFRFLTVAVLTLLLISSPFKNTEAGSRKAPLIDGDKFIAKEVAPLKKTKIIFASEDNGGVTALKLSGLASSVTVAKKQSITVTALDAGGLTVSDYTGTIRFSSSDTQATLPQDYTFLADDQGEHEFSLGFSFITPDEQTITATDIDHTNIKGIIKTKVLTSSSDLDQNVDYEKNFESEDFKRKGDFTLASPASGSYSSNKVEVQGEADYGYTAVIFLNDEEAARTEVQKENIFNYSIEDLEDGTYDLYVKIVDTEIDTEGEEVDVSTKETSDTEEIIIDSTPPELVSLSLKPGTSVSAGATATVTVLSEENLDSVSVIMNEEVYELKETNTPGKYQTDFAVPAENGDYTIDVVLKDVLGNETEVRKKETITVGGAENLEKTPIEAVSLAKLAAPTGVNSAAGREEVTLSWEALETPVGTTLAFYRVYYGPSKDALFASSDTFDSSTSWLITDLSGGEKYYFTVAAVDSEGNEGSQSDAIVALPLAKSSSDSEFIPSAPEPALANGALPMESPESGPATNLLIALSLIGSICYFGTVKLAKRETF